MTPLTLQGLQEHLGSKSHRGWKKSEGESKETGSFKEYNMGTREIWKWFERIDKKPRKLGCAHL